MRMRYGTIAVILAAWWQTAAAQPPVSITVSITVPTTAPTTQPQAFPAGAIVHRDLPYVTGGHARQTLDLYLPANPAARPLPLVLWFHGGGWWSGNKTRPPAVRLLDRGYAVASIGYRYSSDAIFPAQIHDSKAAVRFLRGNAKQYGIDSDRIAVWGGSAGGNLALLLGVGSSVKELEGSEGEYDDVSSRVACVVDYFGTVEFRKPAEFPLNNNRLKYLGGTPDEKPQLAALVTPITHITPDDAPVLIVHGDADRTVTISHSRALEAALKLANVESRFVVVPGGGHGGDKFNTPEINAIVDEFLDRHLKPAAVSSPPGNRPTSR